MSVEKFESSPIIFGDFIKVGADPSDRLYEELADMKKISNVLNEVWILKFKYAYLNMCLYFLRNNVHVHVYTYMNLAMYVACVQYLDDFNMSSSKEMKLVFFMDAIEHVSRYAHVDVLQCI